jgi:hypothetical protein
MAITPIRSKWKSTMTDRERFNNQMHYKPVDRCFNMEFGYWDENYREWDIFVKNGIKSEWEANQFFSFDSLGIIGGNLDICPPFESKVIQETATTKTFINGDGLLAEVPKDGHSTIPHYVKSTVVTPEDWKRVKAERFRRDDPARRIDVAKMQKDHPPTRDYALGINCGSMIGRVRDMLTFEGLAYAMYDYPDMVEDMIETRCQLVEDSLDVLLGKLDIEFACGWEDICFKNGPIVGVDFFKNVITPRYKRIGDRLHAHGIDLWWTDCDGDVRPIMPYLLEGGINCLFPFEVNGCAHPGELFKEYGKELRIMGGVDKIELAKGKPEIKKYLESLVPWVERGGYIPFCDHRCPPNVTPENYLYYLDLKEKMFGMK